MLAHLISLDKAPTVDIDDQASPTSVLVGAPEQIKPTNPLTESLDDILGPALLLIVELSDEPRLFTICVSSNETIHDGRFPSLGMRKGGTNGIDLDILGIVDVDEFFVDERTGRSRVNEVRIEFGRLVSDLSSDVCDQLHLLHYTKSAGEHR